MDAFGSMADLYDGEFRSFSADVDFYLARLQEARVRGPVLELACGSGRVAVPLAAAGYRVTGVDLSETMLRRARRRRRGLPPEAAIRLRFSRQDMRGFQFAIRFQAGLIPFSSFALLTDADGRAACLERLAEHLAPGAPLLIDLPAPPAGDLEPLPRTVSSTFVLPPFRHLVVKDARETPDPRRAVTAVHYHYRVRSFMDDRLLRERRSDFELARVSRAEIEGMLYAVGFDVTEVMGDYRGRPFGPRSPRMIVQAVLLP